ncbi:MAG TPA: hypothetical protein VJI68_00055 [Candidatus Nanoarchaeia archaeon]|nr:hypothetical protein [Candidatus Nanoarchaeia archaeon]
MEKRGFEDLENQTLFILIFAAIIIGLIIIFMLTKISGGIFK